MIIGVVVINMSRGDNYEYLNMLCCGILYIILQSNMIIFGHHNIPRSGILHTPQCATQLHIYYD